MSPLLSFLWRRRQPLSPSTGMATPSSTPSKTEKLASTVDATNTSNNKMANNNSGSINNRFARDMEMNLTIRSHTDNTGTQGGVPQITTLTSCSSSEEEGTTNRTKPINTRAATYQNDITRRNHQFRHQPEPIVTNSTSIREAAAVTPDGFKLRRSICEIRNELIQFRDDVSHRQQEQEQHRTSAAVVPRSNRRNDHSISSTVVSETVPNKTSTTKVNSTATVLNDSIQCRAIVPVPSTTREQMEQELYRTSHGDRSNMVLPVLPRVQQSQSNMNYFVNRDANFNSSLAVLPPIPIRSWSTDGNTTPATNASSQNFYGSSTGRVSFATNGSATSTGSRTMMQQITPTAESPHLEPGRTRTAVGNLIVAMEQSMQLDPPGTTPLQNISHHYTHDTTTWEYSPQEQNVEPMFSPLLMNHRSNSNAQNRSIHKSAKSNRSGNSGTIPPLPMIAEQGTKRTIEGNEKLYHDGTNGLSSNTNSRHIRNVTMLVSSGTPYERTAPLSTKKQYQHPIHRPQENSHLVSNHHSTHSSILPSMVQDANEDNRSYIEDKHQNGYNWTVTSTPSQSSSNSTGSKAASKRTITSTSNSIVVFDNDHMFLSQQMMNTGNQYQSGANKTDRSIQLRKAKSQNRVKEELIISALERLQDDLQLVSDVESLLQLGNNQNIASATHQSNSSRVRHVQFQQQSSMYDWFISTPMDKEGILTGFTDMKRYAILDKIDFLLHEFIDTNSSDVPHPSLREALVFCSLLVKMAIPESEKEDSSLQGTEEIGHWRFSNGLREVIGLTLLDGASSTPTHDQIGGDISFFSLPDDDRHDNCDTPMTSNVSIGASTLTSIVRDQHGVPRPAFGTSIALQQQHQKQYNGLYLRQAIQLFTTGIQKMSIACNQLVELKGTSLNPSSLLQVADMIQKSYLQLLSMNQSDLKSIVDAFEFEICANSFIDDGVDKDLDQEEICEIIDDDEEEAPEIRPVKSVDSPILFAETIGFGILNASSQHDDLSFDNSFDDTGSSNKMETPHPQPLYHSSLTGHAIDAYTAPQLLVSLPPPTDNFQHHDGNNKTSIPPIIRQLPQNSIPSPGLTLDTFFQTKHHQHIETSTPNHFDNDNHSLTSFTTASYKSIRLEI